MKKKLRLTAIAILSVVALANAQRGNNRNPSLDSLINEKEQKVLQNKLTQLKNGSEKDLSLLLGYYNSTKMEAQADSVIQIAIKKYPKGDMAFVQFQNTLFTTAGGKKQEDFFLANKNGFEGKNLDYSYYSIANAYATEGNVPKMKEYGAMVKDPQFRSATIRLNGRSLMAKDIKAAEEYIKPEVEALLKQGIPAEPIANAQANGGMPDQSRSHYLEFMDLYVSILIKNDKYEEAFKYAKEAYDNRKKKSDELKGNYAFLLNKTGRHQEALPLLTEIISEGKGSQTLKVALKESFSTLNPNKDAAAYLAELEAGMQAKIEEEIAKLAVNEAAPNFVVTDVNGKVVSLSDFAGKTIVLDFWATWCGPCKKSFPAMQMAVNKFKNDPNVKFLFIHTWEHSQTPQKDAMQYLADSKFNLPLYMDVKNPITKVNAAVTAFGVKGIPAKFVIDGKGKIRFKMMGFSGGDDAAVAELSAMIEAAKKQS